MSIWGGGGRERRSGREISSGDGFWISEKQDSAIFAQLCIHVKDEPLCSDQYELRKFRILLRLSASKFPGGGYYCHSSLTQ